MPTWEKSLVGFFCFLVLKLSLSVLSILEAVTWYWRKIHDKARKRKGYIFI